MEYPKDIKKLEAELNHLKREIKSIKNYYRKNYDSFVPINELYPRIKELKDRGQSFADIAFNFGVSRQRIHQIYKKYNPKGQ